MGTSQRMGTAQRMANGQPLQSVGLSTNVVVDHRPVTRQGLTGMHTKPLGPGRQIADDKYFILELRTRISDITDEMVNMAKENETRTKDNERFKVLTKAYSTSLEEVKTLEGQLADFNLALDKLRTNTSVEDIKSTLAEISGSNQQMQHEVDQVFISSQTEHAITKEVRGEIASTHDGVARRLDTLGDEVAAEYRDGRDHLGALQQQRDKRVTQIRLMDTRIAQLRVTLQSSDYKMHEKGLGLKKLKTSLLAQRVELEDDTDASLSPEELKEKIRQKVKDANAEVEASERRLKDLDATVEKQHDAIRLKEQALAEAKKHAQKSKKYEAVYERDRKMQEFLDEFEGVFKAEMANKGTLKSTIVALMKHISSQIATSENLPDASQLSDMKDELTFKEQKLNNSKNTLTLLESDLSLRKEELQKIENLDKKINAELSTLKDKITSMNVEMSQFKSDAELKHDATEAKKKLLKEKQRTKKLKDASQHQVQIYGQAYNKRKKELAGNETMKRIDALEQKLRTYSSTVFSLQDFIDSRKRESDYESIRQQVNEIAKSINKNIIDNINAK